MWHIFTETFNTKGTWVMSLTLLKPCVCKFCAHTHKDISHSGRVLYRKPRKAEAIKWKRRTYGVDSIITPKNNWRVRIKYFGKRSTSQVELRTQWSASGINRFNHKLWVYNPQRPLHLSWLTPRQNFGQKSMVLVNGEVGRVSSMWRRDWSTYLVLHSTCVSRNSHPACTHYVTYVRAAGTYVTYVRNVRYICARVRTCSAAQNLTRAHDKYDRAFLSVQAQN